MSYFKLATPLEELVNQSALSKAEIAKRAGISRATLYNLLNGDVAESRLSTLVKFCAAIGVHPLQVIQPYIKYHSATFALADKASGTAFIEDVTYPDNSTVFPGQTFIKTWSVLNSGKEPWEGLVLTCQDTNLTDKERTYGLVPTHRSVPIPFTPPGERTLVSVELTAPELPCVVKSEWKTTNSEGELVFPDKHPLYCLIKVCPY